MTVDTEVGARRSSAHPGNHRIDSSLADTSDIQMPGWADIYVSGKWEQRYEGRWRDGVDLATSDVPTAYAAGLADGYEQAVADLGELHRLLCYWLEVLP